MGVYLEEDKFCQVSINLTNYLVTAPHMAFEQVRFEAARRGIEIQGSEVVGLIPLEALVLAAEYYVWRDKLARPKSSREALELVHDRMGLSSFRPFAPAAKIIEFALSA
jgi:glutamate formiminotransferase/formiminotetrahydrofolate cyclodeaminase